MNLLSLMKATVLSGADIFNAAVGGPQPFTRRRYVDPSVEFSDDMARRDAIASFAEAELAAFVRNGVYVAQKPNDMGDCAIWQGVYTAMTVMRWTAKPSAETRQAMQAATEALARYFYPTGPGQAILVRGAMPQALEHDLFHIDPNHAARYFTDTCAGTVYAYREDASLDSLLGVMFGAAFVGRFGDSAARAALAEPLALFANGFEREGFRLTNRDGSPTTYGNCAPGFFQAPVRNLAAALPSLVADGPNGAAWRGIAQKYGREFATTDTQVPGRISWVNAHLAMLANLTFVCAAPVTAPGFGPACAGLRTLVDKYADAGNAFLIYAAARLGLEVKPSQRDKADKVLIEFPLGAKPNAGLNSSVAPALQPVPVWQRPPCDVIWQRNPYAYSGSESHDYNRLDYLIAHYFQRSF